MATIISTLTYPRAHYVRLAMALNVLYTNTLNVPCTEVENSPEFLDAMDAAAAAEEETVKTFGDFTTQDTNRNATWSLVSYADGIATITVECTVENAIAETGLDFVSDEVGAALEADLQAQVNTYEGNYKVGYKFTDL